MEGDEVAGLLPIFGFDISNGASELVLFCRHGSLLSDRRAVRTARSSGTFRSLAFLSHSSRTRRNDRGHQCGLHASRHHSRSLFLSDSEQQRLSSRSHTLSPKARMYHSSPRFSSLILISAETGFYTHGHLAMKGLAGRTVLGNRGQGDMK